MSDKNKQEANDFLAENSQKEGITTTDSGLQYRVIKAGDGKQPDSSQTVRVHYRGRLLDGSEFDSSYRRGTPAEFPVNAVIQGWVEGLQLMNEGSHFEFFIHPDLGYGERGAGNVIPANALLIFEVELIKVK